MTIRPAQMSDLPALPRVHVETWEAAYRGLLPDALIDSFTLERRIQQWTGWLTQPTPGVRTFAALDDAGEPFGFATAGPITHGRGFEGELLGLYVHPQRQRIGAGRALIASAATYLFQSHLRSMIVWVLAANPACQFYERLGGRLVAREIRDLYGWRVDEAAYGWDDITVLR